MENDGDYFVMLTTQNGRTTPLNRTNGELAYFASMKEAIESAEGSVLGKEFGFEVFAIGDGVYWK